MGKEDFVWSKQLVERPCSENDHEKSHELKVKVMVLKGARGQATSSRPPITVSISISLNSCFDYQSSALTEEGMAYTKEFCIKCMGMWWRRKVTVKSRRFFNIPENRT